MKMQTPSALPSGLTRPLQGILQGALPETLPGVFPRYAGFWRRTAASVIDTVVYGVIMGLVLGPTMMSSGLLSTEGLIRTALILLFTVIMWLRFLGTPGKLLLECQVVDADTLEPMSPKQAMLRYVGYIASTLPLFLGFLWVARDARKQGFHDKIANTVVVFQSEIEMDDESSKSLEQLMAELR
ncbi:MAG: RDD family protein [Ectothiorhodospiraceae bacterium]|nr:RDD family protein [Ectothiorhodospiraceae bacterium]